MRRVNFRLNPEAGAGEEGRPRAEGREGGSRFYPLQELLQEVVQQEKLLWKNTQGVRIPPTGSQPCGAAQELCSQQGWAEVTPASSSGITIDIASNVHVHLCCVMGLHWGT